MSAHLYIEGAESKEDQIRCREGFRRLLQNTGFTGRLPRLSACGGRDSVFDDFKIAHSSAECGHFVAMLIDSEDPMKDIDKAWEHLKDRDNWDKPAGADDEQVLFMTTCMETWIVADRPTLESYYGQNLQVSALPPTNNLENRNRAEVQDKLEHATRNCTAPYKKGKHSFLVVSNLNPVMLEPLPSFVRLKRILNEKL